MNTITMNKSLPILTSTLLAGALVTPSIVTAQNSDKNSWNNAQKSDQNKRNKDKSHSKHSKAMKDKNNRAASNVNPYGIEDETWVSISGTAESADDEEFVLDYGSGTITVEMDDWSWYERDYEFLNGDKVTVYGQIDDDFLEGREIEASSVYVEGLNTHFDVGEYSPTFSYTNYDEPVNESRTEVRGTVREISGREFTIDMGDSRLQIDTSDMAYNPVDRHGYQQVEVGDRVSVSGEIDVGFFDDTEFSAESIVTLEQDERKQNAMANDRERRSQQARSNRQNNEDQRSDNSDNWSGG